MCGPKVLVVDDEPKILRLVGRNLQAEGYLPILAANGDEALRLAAREQPDLVLLDLRLPDIDGLEVCRQLRQFSQAPVIMLTARAREIDKLQGFKAGADDYITKPFSVREMLARIEAVLRRVKDGDAGDPVIRIGRLTLDLDRRQALVNGDPVELTPTEYNLLSELMVNRGKVLTHEQLLRAVWGPEYVDSVDYLRVYVSHLRRKLGEGNRDELITTVPGVGYVIQDDADDPGDKTDPEDPRPGR